MNIVSLLLSLFIVSPVFAALPPSFKAGRVTGSVQSEYFWTSANFDNKGEKQNLVNDNQYKNFLTSIDALYAFGDGWTIGGGTVFSYAQSTDPFEDRTNSKLTDGHLVAQKFLRWSMMRLIPEIKASFTLDKVDPAGNDVLTSDGVNTYQAGSWIVLNMSPVRGYGYLGYQYREDDRSDLLPWTAGIVWRASQFIVSGEFGGYQTIRDDRYIDTPTVRTAVTNAVDGGSLRYYAVSPSLTEVRALVGYAVSRDWMMSLGFAHGLVGENTAAGESVLLGLTFGIDSSPGQSESYEDRKATMRKKKQDSTDFEPQLEEYDESLFDASE